MTFDILFAPLRIAELVAKISSIFEDLCVVSCGWYISYTPSKTCLPMRVIVSLILLSICLRTVPTSHAETPENPKPSTKGEPSTAALSDSELISRAFRFAFQRPESKRCWGALPQEVDAKAGLTPGMKGDNEIQVTRQPISVSFLEHGEYVDGCCCLLKIQFDTAGVPNGIEASGCGCAVWGQ